VSSSVRTLDLRLKEKVDGLTHENDRSGETLSSSFSDLVETDSEVHAIVEGDLRGNKREEKGSDRKEGE